MKKVPFKKHIGVAGSNRGLDLNQRPLGYEREKAQVEHPLISRAVARECSNRRLVPCCTVVADTRVRLSSFWSGVGAKREQLTFWVLPNESPNGDSCSDLG